MPNKKKKNTSGTSYFLENCLVSWSSRKQNFIVLSKVEAEYVEAESCCAQLFRMKQAFDDYELKLKNIPVFCDNTSAITLSKIPIQHSQTNTFIVGIIF